MSTDPIAELEFALAEGDAIDPPADLRARVLAAAADARRPGPAVDAPEWISGAEAFRRAVSALDALLGELSATDWRQPALRDLDVQGLVGHLIGVEETFVDALDGSEIDLDHITSTQAAAVRQANEAPLTTHRQWFDAVTATIGKLEAVDAATPTRFYGVTLPLDDLLVIRAFEMWIHDEDIRRATKRPLSDPDPARLARMVDLATTLLPAGIASVGHARSDATVRLVLTGTGGGTWDVNLDGSGTARRADTRIVVDAAQFCRVVGNREDQHGSEAAIDGDADIAAGVFLGAAALALD